MKRLKEDIQHPVLSFYQALPAENLNYQKFKDKAFERFRILKKVKSSNLGLIIRRMFYQ